MLSKFDKKTKTQKPFKPPLVLKFLKFLLSKHNNQCHFFLEGGGGVDEL